jgi:hypothetical protein
VQEDLLVQRQIADGQSRLLGEIRRIIGVHEEDDPLLIARERMDEIAALKVPRGGPKAGTSDG